MALATVVLGAAREQTLAEALDLGPDVWDQVLQRSGSASPFLSWAWHRACADAMSAPDADRRAIVIQSGAGVVQGLLPIRVQRERFRGVPVMTVGWAFGDFGCPDHLDLLVASDADLQALAHLLDDLPWTILKLDNLAESAGNIDRLCAVCAQKGWIVRRRSIGRCPYLDLPESWDAYLASLSAHARHAIRRRERKLSKEHHVALIEHGRERLDSGLRHLQQLHGLRWQNGGAFRDSAWERLHRRFAALLAERGQLRLFTLEVDGVPAAAWYGFAMGDTVFHYQSGRDLQWERHRVGSVMTGLMIRRAIEQGHRRFDFLRGEESYKWEWTRTARTRDAVLMFRPGVRGAALRGLDQLAHAARRVMGK